MSRLALRMKEASADPTRQKMFTDELLVEMNRLTSMEITQNFLQAACEQSSSVLTQQRVTPEQMWTCVPLIQGQSAAYRTAHSKGCYFLMGKHPTQGWGMYFGSSLYMEYRIYQYRMKILAARVSSTSHILHIHILFADIECEVESFKILDYRGLRRRSLCSGSKIDTRIDIDLAIRVIG